MTEASDGRGATGVTSAGFRPDPARGDGVPSDGSGTGTSVTGTSAPGTPQGAPPGPSKALAGPFTLREVVFGAGAALVFIGTLLPFIGGRILYTNFWSSASLFFIGIGILLPVIALALLAGRRLGSAGLRVGSLSVDQFASVAAVLASTYFFLQTVTAFHVGPLVALIGSLGMLAATVVGPFLPGIKNDFADRPEVPARTAARPITAAQPRPPKAPKPPKPARTAGDAPGTGSDPVVSRPVQGGQAGINPAAAAVRQNGAGLYGAGGAGAVGAGAAASGQSGMERDSSTLRAPQADEAPAPIRSGQDSGLSTHTAQEQAGGAHAVGQAPDDHGADEHRSSADSTSGQAEVVPAEETRVHDVVRDDSTRTYESADSSADSSGESAADYSTGSSTDERGRQEPITATRSADEEPVVEAFWFAVGSPRPVYDEQTGREVFRLQPGDWEVGIEDRGGEFLVQDKRTGAVGILRDLRNIERAPRD